MRTYIFILFTIISLNLSAQVGTLEGIVLSEDGEPLPFATVAMTDTLLGASTDIDGRFNIKMPIGRHEVSVTMLGYEELKQKVTIRKDETTKVRFSLLNEAAALTEVLVSEADKRSRSEASIADDGYMKDMAKTKALGGAATMSYSIEESEVAFESSGYDADWAEMPEEPAAPDWEKMDEDDLVMKKNTTKAGQMTAGEWSDIKNWEFFSDVISKDDWKGLPEYWGFEISQPQSVQVTNSLGVPIPNAEIQLLDVEGTVLYSALSDNSGSAILFPAMFGQGAGHSIKVSHGNEKKTVRVQDASTMQTIPVEIEIDPVASKVIDVAFTVDATGSMGDEMNYLKTELKDVVERVKKDNPGVQVRIGLVFYRDQGDAYIVRSFPFTESLGDALKNISDQHAAGGGDYPEAVHSGLATAIDGLDWSEDAKAKLNFLILDAPPHYNDEVLSSLQKSTQSASEQGIRMVPVTASGIEKDTEFLMRFMAIATGGTYVFITDHSGIGNSHLEVESTIGDYEVEFLNDLMVRLINAYSAELRGDDLVVK